MIWNYTKIVECENENDIKKMIVKDIQKILRDNDFICCYSMVGYYFNNVVEFVYRNLLDNIIKSEKDYKYYLVNEIDLSVRNIKKVRSEFYNLKFLDYLYELKY